jgi:hypothetical protein
MKKISVVISCFAFATTVSAGIFSSGQTSRLPCLTIEKACKAAGFVSSGAKNGKGLFIHCMQPILAGQKVTGVTVDPADVKACKQKNPRS